MIDLRRAAEYRAAAILLALVAMKNGDYARARATLEEAERDIRLDDAAALARVAG
jgi:cellobiose-specific phosphotransferase system component IIA